MIITKNLKLILCVAVVLFLVFYFVGFGPGRQSFIAVEDGTATLQEISDVRLLYKLSKMKNGMRFGELDRAVNLTSGTWVDSGEHGGRLYEWPQGKYVIIMRFEHPENNQTMRDVKLNMNPIINLR